VDRQIFLLTMLDCARSRRALIFIAFVIISSQLLHPLDHRAGHRRSPPPPSASPPAATARRSTRSYDDEIGELADTINDMSVKIGQAEKMQSEFVSSVSHELRTPLTAISGWGETLLSSETSMEPGGDAARHAHHAARDASG
jgi:two-component system OmpR family sensor kinase